MRQHPGAGLALGGRNFGIRHHLGNLTAQTDGLAPTFEGCEIEPFMRRDQVDDTSASACPKESAFEQYVRDRVCLHRCRGIQIEEPLKHLLSALVFFYCAVLERDPVQKDVPSFSTPLAGLSE